MNTIINTITNQSDLKDLSVDLIEIILDESLKEGVLQEIPVIKSVIALSKTYNSIVDKIHLKKTLLVLLELKNISIEERLKFIHDLKDRYSSGGDKLMLAISKIDTYEKCTIFGKLSLMKALDKISLDDFLRITKIIQDGYLEDIKTLKNIGEYKFSKILGKSYYSLENVTQLGDELICLLNLGILYQYTTEPTPIRRDEYIRDNYYGGEINIKYDFTLIGQTLKSIYCELFND